MDKTVKNILILDDNTKVIETLRDILEMEGYIVDTAETGREAIQKFNSKFYDLALLDIVLSDISGTKILKILHETHPETIKIMITGNPSLENAIQSLNLGACAYLIKPINLDKLLKIISEKLQKQEEAKKIGEEKVMTWIETRVSKIEDDNLTIGSENINFDELLLDTINSIFSKIYEPTVKKTIMSCVAATTKLNWEEKPLNLENFDLGLTNILGSGAQIIKDLLLKQLSFKVNLVYDIRSTNFQKQVQELKKKYEKQRFVKHLSEPIAGLVEEWTNEIKDVAERLKKVEQMTECE